MLRLTAFRVTNRVTPAVGPTARRSAPARGASLMIPSWRACPFVPVPAPLPSNDFLLHMLPRRAPEHPLRLPSPGERLPSGHEHGYGLNVATFPDRRPTGSRPRFLQAWTSSALPRLRTAANRRPPSCGTRSQRRSETATARQVRRPTGTGLNRFPLQVAPWSRDWWTSVPAGPRRRTARAACLTVLAPPLSRIPPSATASPGAGV